MSPDLNRPILVALRPQYQAMKSTKAHFSQFAWLKPKGADVQPAAGSVDFFAKTWNEYDDQERGRDDNRSDRDC